MKRYFKFILTIICSLPFLYGCGKSLNDINPNDKLNIVCTTFAQYDWVSNIIKGNEENINLTLLMDKGGDLHNFQPSALDIAKVSGCDIFIYVGGESDTWVDDALSEAQNPGMVAVNLLSMLENGGTLYEEEHFESNRESGHSHDEEYEYDEHVWLSLKNAVVLTEYICNIISDCDYDNASLYEQNCEMYVGELSELDTKYSDVVANCDKDTLLFADRFPLRYMVEDYGLKYYAAFEGCSAETEASFSTVAYLSDRMTELKLGAVSVIDNSDKRLAQVIIENSDNADIDIVVFNSMQSVSKDDIDNGMTYISVMQDNLISLETALK